MKRKNKVTVKSCWTPAFSPYRPGVFLTFWLLLFFTNARALDFASSSDGLTTCFHIKYSTQKNVKIFNWLDTLPINDTVPLPQSASTLSAPVTYQATDSMVVDVNGKKIRLYGKNSTIQYAGNELTAPYI
ncbi:MAG: hypothetical protein ACKO5C_04930, partial [Ferruginibacter sp.]